MMKINLPERLRRARRALGFALAAVGVYLVALLFCLPYDRARETAIAVAARAGYDVEIGQSGPSFPFGISFEEIRVRSRTPPTATSKPIQIRLDSMRVALLPIVLSGGDVMDIVVKGLGGRIEFQGKMPKKGAFKIDVAVNDVAMAQIPGAREMFNLPLGGTLAMTAHLESATGKMADAHGELSLKCAACTVGDGKTAAKLGSNPFLSAGLTLPRVRLGDVAGRVMVEKGVARAQGIAIKSPDAEVTLEGEVDLRDPIGQSIITAYLRFKLGEPLLRAAPTIGSILQMAGAAGRRPDGFYGLRVTGMLASPYAALSTTSPVPLAPSTAQRFGAHASTAPAGGGTPAMGTIPGARPSHPPVPPAATPPVVAAVMPEAPPPSLPVRLPPPPPPPPPPPQPASPPPPPPSTSSTDPVAAVPGRPAGPPFPFDAMRGNLAAGRGGSPGGPSHHGGATGAAVPDGAAPPAAGPSPGEQGTGVAGASGDELSGSSAPPVPPPGATPGEPPSGASPQPPQPAPPGESSEKARESTLRSGSV